MEIADDGGLRWHRPDQGFPIYGEELLAEKPAAIVVIVEGEKAADAINTGPVGSELREADGPLTYIAVTGAGGAVAIPRSRWLCLDGREVILWPDNDQPGKQ